MESFITFSKKSLSSGLVDSAIIDNTEDMYVFWIFMVPSTFQITSPWIANGTCMPNKAL
jgi:hypothetical protein